MDDIELVRRYFEREAGDRGGSLDAARSRLDAAIAGEIPSRLRGLGVPARTRARGRVWLLGAVALAASAALLPALLLPTSGYSDLGMQVSTAATFLVSPEPHLLNGAVRLGFVPPGFHLVSDTAINGTLPQYHSGRLIDYSRSTPAGTEDLKIVVYLSASQSRRTIEVAPFKTGNVTGSVTRVHGHRAELEVASPPNPATLGKKQPRPAVSTPGRTCGPPATKTLTTAPRSATVQWIESPGLEIAVVGLGVGSAEVIRVADALTYRPQADCLHDSRGSSACGTGVHSSPPYGRPPIPRGGTEVAAGTIDGHRWVYAASIMPMNSWYRVTYEGAVLDGGCTSTPSSLAPTVRVITSLGGERVASGVVPGWVTSVAATSEHGYEVSQPVLPRSLGGLRFFILSLGRVGGICNDLCRGTVTLAFYRGATEAATVTMTNGGLGGFSMSHHTVGP